MYTTAEGLRLMYMGGLQGETSSEYSPTYTSKDIAALSGTVDILITSEAPEGIDNLSAKPLGKGSPTIATLVQKINPRYHFASEGVFYEREPYDNGRGTTRFLSLGDVGGERWFYAFKINVSATTEKAVKGATANPFKKRQLEAETKTCRVCGDPSHLSYDCPQKKDQRRKKRKRVIGRTEPPSLVRILIAANDCFFCLSNVNVAKHLIVSIGTEVYLALAKGPLTTAKSVNLAFPGHILIIPIAHTPVVTPSEAAEMEAYRQKLVRFFDARDCHAVTFEIHQAEGIHAHWQVIPVPKSTSLDEEFIRGFDQRKMTLEKRSPGDSEEYCRVVLPSGTYVATLPAIFDLQLPRRILAKVLKLEDREDWRACIQTDDEERADAAAFRTEFEAGDSA
jgi:diadenosine tetraphosphate (Ap4A) HIT family hydrolase